MLLQNRSCVPAFFIPSKPFDELWHISDRNVSGILNYIDSRLENSREGRISSNRTLELRRTVFLLL